MALDLGKILLLGGGGYLAYKYFTGGFSTQPAEKPAGGIQPAQTAAPLTNPSITYQLMLKKTQADNFTRGTVDQWDFYYGTPEVRGVPAPDPESWGFTGDKRNLQMTLDEWWAVATAHGLSGRSAGYVRGGF